MKRILYFLALSTLTFLSASCAQSRLEQMKLAENVKITCNPEVLAYLGGNVPAEMTVSYPDGYFYPQAILEVTPVLVYEGGEQAAETFTFQGEKVKDNFTVVPSSGGSVTKKLSFKYVEGMAKSHLELRSVAYYGNVKVEIPSIKVADGVNITPLLACTDGEFDFKADNYQYVIHQQAEGQIHYDVNSSTVKTSELRSESIKELQAALQEIAADPRFTVKSTQVVAYASPEGGQSLNAKLSDKRATSAQKAWKSIDKNIPTADLNIRSVGQDWEGFQEAIEASNITDKELILRVLSMYSDPAVREKEIRNMSQIYTEINKKVFPELRRARFIADVDYLNFSDEELEEMSHKAIDMLDEDAILRVAANSDNMDRKAELYQTAVRKYGSDKGNFNLAVIALANHKTDEAAAYLSKVRESDADVLNAKGVCELQKGNLDAAAKLFEQSGSDESKKNLGAIDILKGNYTAAVNKLAGSEGMNTAIAYILTGQLDKADAAVTCKCGKADYLRAVIAARKGDAAGVKSNLESACQKIESLKVRSQKDVEFANYR